MRGKSQVQPEFLTIINLNQRVPAEHPTVKIEVETSIPGLTRRNWIKLTAGVSAATLTGSFFACRGQTPQSAGEKSDTPKAMFQNPLFAGDYPDCSILRVGEDFYMTHTSYSYAPGLMIWHSRDLVNWTPISQVTNNSVGEIWAPDLIENDGHYFIYFPLEGRLFVVHTDNPRGPWSAPIDLNLGGIDPGHVVAPDGKRYLYSAGGHAIELSPDGLSTVGQSKKVYDGWVIPKDWKTEGTWLESPKLTRRGEYYYLTSAEGGTAGPPTSHMAIVARSKSPLGPWENSPHNPLIHTYSVDEAWWSVGHATLVSTPDNRWYIAYHGYRKGFQTLGRNVLLEPMEWTSDGWPHAPMGARRGEPMPAPMGVAQRPMIELSDDFKAPILKATWGAWKEPDMSRYQVGNGALTVRAKGNSYAECSPLTIRARDESYEVQVTAKIEGESGAALGLEYNPKVAIFVALRKGQLFVNGPKANLATREWAADTAWFKLINRKNRLELLVSEDGQRWQSLLADFDVSGFNQNEQHGGFQSARPALAAYGIGSARFTDFRYSRS
jgi:xylan 1,4-beta-xylosidase